MSEEFEQLVIQKAKNILERSENLSLTNDELKILLLADKYCQKQQRSLKKILNDISPLLEQAIKLLGGNINGI